MIDIFECLSKAHREAIDEYVDIYELFDPDFIVDSSKNEYQLPFWEENRMALLISNFKKLCPEVICIQNVKLSEIVIIDLLIIDDDTIYYIEFPRQNRIYVQGRTIGNLGELLLQSNRELITKNHLKDREEIFLFFGDITAQEGIELVPNPDFFDHFSLEEIEEDDFLKTPKGWEHGRYYYQGFSHFYFNEVNIDDSKSEKKNT